MRSKFEKRIAQLLHSKGVVYEYEAYEFDYEEPLDIMKLMQAARA